MDKRDLLIEVGTEELPPKALLSLSQAFEAEIAAQLRKAGLEHDGIEPFATPRRLALLVRALPTRQPDSTQERLGPAVPAAFDAEGKPTKAAQGFARSCGVAVEALQRKLDGSVEKLMFRSVQKGADTASLLPPMLTAALDALPIPKRMRWGSSRDEFVRPVHWVVLLFGSEVVPATILGVRTGSITRGHRFHHPEPLSLQSPGDYEQVLLKANVIASFERRRDEVRQQVLQEARQKGARAIIDPALLDEVTSLVEWPVALTGNFDGSFLAVPKEALISAMKEHQKCFHLLDAQDQILPHFITLSNLASRDPAQVVAGNEKVIRPRLADAAFFFEQDKRMPLATRIEKLKTVVFQQQLGTLYDKSQRVGQLASWLAGALDADLALAQRAAALGKCDLMTSMVYEFADLQGTMGYHYALHDGEAEEVARALFEQYLPRHAGDSLPQTRTGMILALAERLDTITGLFGIGQPPSGSKDPFALRRAALGVLRIIIEGGLSVDLFSCVREAVRIQGSLSTVQNLDTTVIDFIYERLRAWYADDGVGADVFQAVDAVRPASPLEFDARIKAVRNFSELPQASKLASANKRVSNILQKSAGVTGGALRENLLVEEAEKALAAALASVSAHVEPLLQARDFTPALAAMADLQESVDAFFDKVMVNVDDEALRNNRLQLLHGLRALFLRVADISLLQHV